MSVGIMDADLSEYLYVPFNLECMKISTYCKKHNQLVTFAPKFTPERHEHFVYRKDYPDQIYPLNLATTPNVHFGGLAFSNNKYIPLPEDIEKMKPDTMLYNKMKSLIIVDSKAQQRMWRELISAEHIRLSLDDKTIWPNYGYQFQNLKNARNLIIHDYDLGKIKDSFEVVQGIMRRARTDGWATRIGMKFPVQVSDGQSLLNWSSLRTNSIFYSLQYNGVIDDDAFIEWVGTCRDQAVFRQIIYNVTAVPYDEDEFTKNTLPKILRQVIISRSYRVFFSLTYDEGYFKDKRWCAVLELLNYYMHSYSGQPTARYVRKIGRDTLFDFAKSTENELKPYRYRGDFFTKPQIRQIFAFVKEHNYPLFKDFYECSAESLGGKL